MGPISKVYAPDLASVSAKDLQASLHVERRDAAYIDTGVVSAQLSRAMVAQLNDESVVHLARIVGMTQRDFADLLVFLTSDAEIADRFTAYRTARRLRGE